MSGWLNILIMHVNTNKLSTQNSLICCRPFGITSNSMNTWEQINFEEGRNGGACRISSVELKHMVNNSGLCRNSWEEKIKYLGTCTSRVICCSPAEGKPKGSQVPWRWLQGHNHPLLKFWLSNRGSTSIFQSIAIVFLLENRYYIVMISWIVSTQIWVISTNVFCLLQCSYFFNI